VTTPHLLNPARSGVYHAPAHVDAVRALVAGGDALWLEVDLERARGKDDVLQAFARVCEFPATFGRNWDALADALQDLSWLPARGYVVHLRNGTSAARALGLQWATLLEVLEAASHYWKARGKPFVALVDGAAELQPWI
jgi:hypothetical protein